MLGETLRGIASQLEDLEAAGVAWEEVRALHVCVFCAVWQNVRVPIFRTCVLTYVRVRVCL